jgi:quercetin dioxygenase-like cupin family protein
LTPVKDFVDGILYAGPENRIKEVPMKTIEALTAAEVENPHGVSVRKLHETSHVVASLITLKPGEALHLHKTPVDAFFYALEGQGTVEIGGERQTVRPHTLVPSPAGITHRLLNESSGMVRFLVVKTPGSAGGGKIV